jgi:hypothetical protein
MPSQDVIKLNKISKEIIANLVATSQSKSFNSPEYYNILNLKAVSSKKTKLLQVSGKPSEFVEWADEAHAATAIGKYTHVAENDVIKYEVVQSDNPVMQIPIQLARDAQKEGFILARTGDSGPFYHPEKFAEGNVYDSLKTLRKETLPGDSVANKFLPGIQIAKTTVESFAPVWEREAVPEYFGKQLASFKNIKDAAMESQPAHTLR